MKLEFLHSKRPVVLAPLAGYSVRPYRRICLEMGAAAVWSGMISADGLVRGDGESRRLAYFDETERPIGLQLFGADPQVLAEATAILSDMGPDFIDLNAGCPVKKVCKRNGGAALLRDPEGLGRIVEVMVKAGRVPITIKIRVGWQSDERSHLHLARVIEQAGASALTVHARTRAGRFKAKARWEWIAEVAGAVSLPVIGNGDVFGSADAERMFMETGCRAVMIGRGAMGDPWIFESSRAWLSSQTLIPPPSLDTRVGLWLRHARELAAERREDLGMREFRKFLVRYSRGVPHGAALRKHLPELSTLERLETALDELVQLNETANE